MLNQLNDQIIFFYQDGVFKGRPFDEELSHSSDDVGLAQDEEGRRAGPLVVVGGVGPARHRVGAAQVAGGATGADRHAGQLFRHQTVFGNS